MLGRDQRRGRSPVVEAGKESADFGSMDFSRFIRLLPSHTGLASNGSVFEEGVETLLNKRVPAFVGNVAFRFAGWSLS